MLNIYYVIFNTKSNSLELSVSIQIEACDVPYKKKPIVKKYTCNNKNLFEKKNEGVIFTRLPLWKKRDRVQKEKKKLPQNEIIHIT